MLKAEEVLQYTQKVKKQNHQILPPALENFSACIPNEAKKFLIEELVDLQDW